MYQNLDAAKVVIRQKCTVLSAYYGRKSSWNSKPASNLCQSRGNKRGCQYSRKPGELKADLQKDREYTGLWYEARWKPSAGWSSCAAHTAEANWKEDIDSMVNQCMPIRKMRKSEQIHVKTWATKMDEPGWSCNYQKKTYWQFKKKQKKTPFRKHWPPESFTDIF